MRVRPLNGLLSGVVKDSELLLLLFVFILGSDKLCPVSFTVFPKGSVTGCDSSIGSFY